MYNALPRRRSYWLGRCLSSLRSISSSHILVSRSRRYLANSWETSRRAIRPCTASSVLCGLAVSISRARCSAFRWLSSMMPPCVQFLDAFRLTLPKIHKQHTAGEGMMKSRGPRGRNPATTGFGNVSVLAILLDPVALIVLLVPILHGAPGHPVGAVLFSVLILCGVEGLLVDLLGVLGEVVLHVVRKLRDLLVGHLGPPFVACPSILTTLCVRPIGPGLTIRKDSVEKRNLREVRRIPQPVEKVVIGPVGSPKPHPNT